MFEALRRRLFNPLESDLVVVTPQAHVTEEKQPILPEHLEVKRQEALKYLGSKHIIAKDNTFKAKKTTTTLDDFKAGIGRRKLTVARGR